MSLLKSATTVGGYTMISRVLGFVRDMLIASVLGTGPVADAFVVAFRFPNLFRRLFGEGAFNSAFVPLFAKRLEADGTDVARGFANETLTGLFFVLVIFLAFAELTMPVLMYLFAPGFATDPDKFDLAVVLTRIAFPYLLFMSLVALLGGVLNSMHRFAAAAAAPIVLNIVLITTLGFVLLSGWGNSAASGKALVWGVSFAGLAQLVLLWWAAKRAGMGLKLQRPRWTPALKRLVTLGVPGIIAGGITQLNLVISTIIASWQPGAASWLYYADRVYQLPLGIIGVAIGIVLLPQLSRQLAADDEAGVDSSQNRALETSLFLTVPAAMALMAIPVLILNVLFERGAFTSVDTRASALALAAFAAGLPAFVMIKIFSPGFFAREDTKTPMKFAAIAVAVNIIGAVSLFPVLGHAGIAIATTIAAWINASLLAITLTRRGHFRMDAQLRQRLPRMLLAALIMGVVLLGCNWLVFGLFVADTVFITRFLLLAGLVILGVVVYFGLSHFLGCFRLNELKGAFRRK